MLRKERLGVCECVCIFISFERELFSTAGVVRCNTGQRKRIFSGLMSLWRIVCQRLGEAGRKCRCVVPLGRRMRP